MNLLTTPDEIREELQRIKPSKVAVAYIGLGWQKFLSLDTIEEVIVSPTLGSNPKAIRQLFDKLGHDKVHFLDNLHSKIYLSTNDALFGSCNLSNNALMEGNLFEVAALTKDIDILKKLESLFDQYKKEACKKYPSKKEKEKRLSWLRLKHKEAMKRGFLKPQKFIKSESQEDIDLKKYFFTVIGAYQKLKNTLPISSKNSVGKVASNDDGYRQIFVSNEAPKLHYEFLFYDDQDKKLAQKDKVSVGIVVTLHVEGKNMETITNILPEIQVVAQQRFPDLRITLNQDWFMDEHKNLSGGAVNIIFPKEKLLSIHPQDIANCMHDFIAASRQRLDEALLSLKKKAA